MLGYIKSISSNILRRCPRSSATWPKNKAWPGNTPYALFLARERSSEDSVLVYGMRCSIYNLACASKPESPANPTPVRPLTEQQKKARLTLLYLNIESEILVSPQEWFGLLDARIFGFPVDRAPDGFICRLLDPRRRGLAKSMVVSEIFCGYLPGFVVRADVSLITGHWNRWMKGKQSRTKSCVSCAE